MKSLFFRLRKLMILDCVIFLILAGCSSSPLSPGNSRSQQPVEEQLSDPIPVDPLMDNAPMLEYMSRGLIITIEIVGVEAIIVDGYVALVPREEPREDTGNCIRVIGISQGNPVVEKWVPDPRWISVEHQPVEEREVRVVPFSLPLETRIELITVQVKPDAPVMELEVWRIFDEFCESLPDDPLCR